MIILTDAFVRVIVSSIWTNRAVCIIDEDSVSGESSDRASLQIRQKVIPQMFEKVSQLLKYDSNNFFWSLYIYMDTNTNHFTPLMLCVRGNDRLWQDTHAKGQRLNDQCTYVHVTCFRKMSL